MKCPYCEIDLDSLGTTLMHEHIYANNSGWWHCPSCKDRMDLANSSVNMSILGDLRMDPFVNKDNIVLDDVVYSAPGVTRGAISGGRSEITGEFDCCCCCFAPCQ